jgi:putative restriction endonuclease
LFPLDDSNLLAAEVFGRERFDRRVPYVVDGAYYESAMVERNWRSIIQRTVRAIPEAQVSGILRDGLSAVEPVEPIFSGAPGFSAPPQESFSGAPRAFDTVRRARRSLSLRKETLSAYDFRCALTGMGQRSANGEFEPDCCHLKPVEHGGPDRVQNTILVTKTLHWAIDRFLISFDDDLRIVMKPQLEPKYRRMINEDGFARAPHDQRLRPAREFLTHHRRRFLAAC